MVRKSKKGIVGKHTLPGSGVNSPGPGLDFMDQNLTSSKEIKKAEQEAKKNKI